MIAVGVASPIAHGQAMTSTATALVRAKSSPGRAPAPPAREGQRGDHRARSARRRRPRGRPAAGSAPASPAPPRRARRCGPASSRCPTRVARKTKLPVRLMVPPETAAPGAFSTGRLSPVSIDSSTVERAVDHRAVHRHTLAGPDADQVADPHLRGRHVDLLAGPDHPRRARRQAHQPPDRLRRTPARPKLQPASQHDEGDHHGRRLVVGHGPGGMKHVRPERHRHAEQVGRVGTQRYEGGHAGAAVAEIVDEPAVERRPDPELHGSGQRELQPGVAQPRRRPGKDLRHAADQDRGTDSSVPTTTRRAGPRSSRSRTARLAVLRLAAPRRAADASS